MARNKKSSLSDGSDERTFLVTVAPQFTIVYTGNKTARNPLFQLFGLWWFGASMYNLEIVVEFMTFLLYCTIFMHIYFCYPAPAGGVEDAVPSEYILACI